MKRLTPLSQRLCNRELTQEDKVMLGARSGGKTQMIQTFEKLAKQEDPTDPNVIIRRLEAMK